MKKNNVFSISAQLDEEFGPEGSATRAAALNQAWEEYNAQVLLDARKKAGLTQQQLAERIGADKSYISRVERGLTIPTVPIFYRIAAAMGLRVILHD